MVWAEDFLLRISRCKSQNDLFVVASGAVRDLGFSSACYGGGLPQPGQPPKAVIHQNYPPGWMQHYASNKFIELDPTVAMGQHTGAPIVWCRSTFRNAPRLWQDAQDFGLCIGLAQSAWATAGAFGLLSVCREADPLSTKELECIRYRLAWIAQTLHAAMVHQGRVIPEGASQITKREYEVLRLVVAGLTSTRIARSLQMTERTVRFHLANLYLKMQVAGRAELIVKALSMGLVQM